MSTHLIQWWTTERNSQFWQMLKTNPTTWFLGRARFSVKQTHMIIINSSFFSIKICGVLYEGGSYYCQNSQSGNKSLKHLFIVIQKSRFFVFALYSSYIRVLYTPFFIQGKLQCAKIKSLLENRSEIISITRKTLIYFHALWKGNVNFPET